MKKVFVFLFINLGITSIVAQVLILRETMITFFGNELFVGIVLTFWLFWEGMGCLLTQKFYKNKNQKTLILLQLATTLLLPLTIILLRAIRIFTAPYEISNFFTASISTFLILAPFCGISGAIFTTSSWLLGQLAKKRLPQIVSISYFWEVLGFSIGGLLFSFYLIQLPTLTSASLISILNLVVVFFLLVKTRPVIRQWAFGVFFLLLTIYCLLLYHSPPLDFSTQKFRFPNLIEQINSRFGHIAITKSDSQINFYENGTLLGTNEETYFNEHLIHLTLLQQEKPQDILLLGGGFNGALVEILKYPSVEKIDYVELDSEMLEVAKKYLSKELQEALKNPKVKINFADGRAFLKQTKNNYDIAIVNLPNPSTALLNRFYTQEFFEEVKKHLSENGIMATYISSPTDYYSRETQNLLASIYKTIAQVFPHVLVLPEENVLFLASQQIFSNNSQILIKRFNNLGIQTQYLTPAEIIYRLESDRILKTVEILEKNTTAKINSDFYPTAYFYHTAFWQTLFSFKTAGLFSVLQNVNTIWLVFISALLTFLILRIKKPRSVSEKSPVFATALGGLTLMATEILILFTFQVKFGYLYSQIALLLTIILAGMAAGNFLANYKLKDAIKNLKLIEVLIVFYLFFLPFLLDCFESSIAFFILSFTIGFLVGTIFPLTNKLYLRTTEKVGTLYAADLFGSLFGALFPSVIFIPVLGIPQTCLFLGIVNLTILFTPI